MLSAYGNVRSALVPSAACVAVAAVFIAVPWYWYMIVCLSLVLLASTVLITTIATLCWRHLSAADELQLHVRRSCWPPPSPGLSQLLAAVADSDSSQRPIDWRYTGSSVVDHQLHQLLQAVLRDHVLAWYRHVSSSDRSFVWSIHALMRTFIVNVAARAKEVDWVPFITGRVVDIVVQHLRLYRRARAAVISPQGESSPTHEYTPVHGTQSSMAGGDCDAIEAQFFQLEALEGSGKVSRRGVCTDDKRRRQYVRDMARMILHKFLPEKETSCPPVQTVAVEVTSQLLLLPLFQLLSSADFANRLVLWCCSLAASSGISSGVDSTGNGGVSGPGNGTLITTDALRVVLRFCLCCEELRAVRCTVAAEMALLRSRDTGGQQNDEVKDQMSSLSYIDRLITGRLQQLESRRCSVPSTSIESRTSGTIASSAPNDVLPLETLLRNNVGLSYFLDFLADSVEQHLLFFYLNAEAWRLVAEEQLLKQQSVEEPREQEQGVVEELRHSAQCVFDQSLSPSAPVKLPFEERLVHQLADRIRHDQQVSLTWFDNVRAAVVDMLSAERFYPAFQKTVAYRKLLTELDMWRDGEEDDTSSTPTSSLSDRTTATPPASSQSPQPTTSSLDDLMASVRLVRRVDAEVVVSGVACETGRCYTLYSVVITVLRATSSDRTMRIAAADQRSVWTVQRRYSDFHQFRERTIARYPWLSRIPFPGKRAFNNQSAAFVERRRAALATFLSALLDQSLLAQHEGLWQIVVGFLTGRRGSGPTGLGRAVTSAVVAPLRESWRAVGGAADKLQQTAGDVVGGLSRAIRGPDSAASLPPPQHHRGQRHHLPPPSIAVQPLSADSDADDSPLRIVLLLLEEVFDLRSQHQWLRRRVLAILRQLMRAMYGDILNRRIVDWLADLTRPDRVADYVRLLRQTLWPAGSAASMHVPRDADTCLRTRFVARTALLASVGEDIRYLVGAETTRRGVFLICDLLQSTSLNCRLVLVLFEALLELLLPKCDVARYVALVHSNERCHSDSATSSSAANHRKNSSQKSS